MNTVKFPGMDDMLSGIGEQLKLRKNLILKRMLLVFWPVLVTAIASAVFATLFGAIDSERAQAFIEGLPVVPIMTLLVVWFTFLVVYVAVMTIIYQTEKLVWLDAYFDKKTLPPEQSWRIAKHIALPFLWASLFVGAYYLLLPLLGAGVLITIVAFMVEVPWSIYAGIAIGVLTISALYFFTKIPLSMSGFLFLDVYGPDYTLGAYMKELRTLSTAARGKALGRILLTDFGAASVNSLVAATTNTIEMGAGMLAPRGLPIFKLGGDITRAISSEMTSFAQLSAYYLVYRSLQKAVHNTHQRVNSYVYSLAA